MDTHNVLQNYYINQARGGTPSYYVGPSHQKGHGLGGIFSSLFRAAMPVFKSVAPVLKRGAKAVAREAITTGAQIASDALAGDDWKESAAKHGNLASQRLLKKGAKNLINMVGPVKKRKAGKLKSIKGSKFRKINRDIFD